MESKPQIPLNTDEDNLEREKDNVVKLELVTGGKEPPDDAWLNNLEVGTVLLVKNKRSPQDYNLGLFRLVEKISLKTVVLNSPLVRDPLGTLTNLYIIPSTFCNNYYLHEIIGTIETLGEEEEKQEEEKESKDDSSGVQGDGRFP